jgi:hypothetical protein
MAVMAPVRLLCTGNSARSQMAQAITERLGRPRTLGVAADAGALLPVAWTALKVGAHGYGGPVLPSCRAADGC